MSEWTMPGCSFSIKNACKEFSLTEEQVLKEMQLGKLQFQQQCIHGNPYFKLLRSEIELLAKKIHGTKGLLKIANEDKLRKVKTEINSLKRSLKKAEKRQVELLELQKELES